MTLNISETAYRRARTLAAINGQSVEQAIESALENNFAREAEIFKQSVAAGSDKDVLALAMMRTSARQNQRLSRLLQKNKQETLAAAERNELESLVRQARLADLRKAIGIAEAVKRNLIRSTDELP